MIRTPPPRLAAIMALQAQLQTITKADGYGYDLADRVYRNQNLLGDQKTQNPPLLSIIESPRAEFAQYAGNNNEARREVLTILIQGICEDDRLVDTQDEAYYLCHDVERCLARITKMLPGRGKPMFPEEHLLGDKIADIFIAPPVVRPPERDVSAYHFFYLPVRLTLAGEIGQYL